MLSITSQRSLFKNLLLVATLAAIGFAAAQGHFSDLLSERWIDAEVRGQGWRGELLFLFLGSLATAIAVPRQIVAFLGGYAFGFLTGAGLAVLASVLGCILAFSYARWLIRSHVQKRFPGRIRKIDGFLRQHPFSMAVAIRLLPIGSNALVSLTAGVSSVRGLPFFAGSAIGYAPQSMIFALAGSGVSVDPAMRLSLAGGLIIASSLIGIWLYRRHHGALSEDPDGHASDTVSPVKQDSVSGS